MNAKSLATTLPFVVECKSTYPFFETIAAFNVRQAADAYVRECGQTNPGYTYRVSVPVPVIKHASPTEQRIVGKLVQDILAAGYSLSISDGEAFPLENSTDPDAIYAALASTDSDTIYVHIPDRRGSPHIVLVWGNDAHVISDYSASLSGLLAGANALADELEG